MSAVWRSQPERGSATAMALMTWLTLRLGRAATRWLLPFICLYYYAAAPAARRASRAFLARALGREPGAADVLRHQLSFAATLHDRLLLASGGNAPLELEVSGAAEIERLLGRGRGCILVGSHLGSFEILRALGRSRGKPVNVLMHEANAEKAKTLFARLAPELERRVLAAGRPETMLRIKECLERGEIVGILGDRALGRDRTQRCAFFGAPALFPTGPWLLAAALGAPVALFFGLYRGGARYEVIFETLTEGEGVPREARQGVAAGWLARYVARLEHHARRAPYNWFNFYDFWDASAA